jgi:hypothetical protein
MIQPRLKTIEMVKETVSENDRFYSICQLWKRLPKKMMYQAYKNAIGILIENNEIAIDENKKIGLIYRPKLKKKPINKERIIYNLSHYGYDLISYKETKRQETMPTEELIIEILIRYPEARFIEAIPILMIKNKIDSFELYRLAYDFGLINKIGFLLETAFIIAKKARKDIIYLRDLLNEFENKREKMIQYMSAFRDKEFLEKTTPKLMKKWNLRGNFSTEDFLKEAYL